jgi:hypothetical protein
MLNKDMFKGFSLFNDIEDVDLRNRNRAVVLANIAEDNTRNKMISPKGAGLILGYFGLVPPEEREEVKDRFTVNMLQRGFSLSL